MALLHVNCYRGIYTHIQYFAVLSTLPQPVGEANKGEMFTRRKKGSVQLFVILIWIKIKFKFVLSLLLALQPNTTSIASKKI